MYTGITLGRGGEREGGRGGGKGVLHWTTLRLKPSEVYTRTCGRVTTCSSQLNGLHLLMNKPLVLQVLHVTVALGCPKARHLSDCDALRSSFAKRL